MEQQTRVRTGLEDSSQDQMEIQLHERPAQSLSLKVAPKGKEGQPLASGFFHNSSYQWRS